MRRLPLTKHGPKRRRPQTQSAPRFYARDPPLSRTTPVTLVHANFEKTQICGKPGTAVMADHGRRSPASSGRVSPETYGGQYDPFVSPLDRFEMAHLPRRSPNEQGSQDRPRARSAGSISNESLSQDTPFADPRPAGASSYAPIPDENPNPVQGRRSFVGVDSLMSMNSLGPYKTQDPVAQALVDRRAGEIATWKIHWQTPAIIIVLWVGGVMGVLGHHFFYLSLDGHPAENQLVKIRYGTALGYFVKSCLVGSVILSYRQRIWHTFRQKAMTLSAIDGLFSVTEDPTQFINWEMLRNSKLATLMALCSWLIPIASVLSPAALTSEPRTTFTNDTCRQVANLNFTRESFYNFRKEGDYPGSSLVYYNTTDKAATTDGWFDYYDQPSKNVKKLTVTSVYLGKPATYVNASINACQEGYNCTYPLSFQGPGYKCDEIANSTHPTLEDQNVPFNISALAPIGDQIYMASVDLNDYRVPQTDTGTDGVAKPGYDPATLGAFDSEPVLWIGYAINTSQPYPAGSPYRSQWKNIHEPKIFKCIAHHTNYTFEMHYNDTNQIVNRTAREFIAPLIDTTVSLNPANASEYLATPVTNYVLPSPDVEKYKLTAAYHALGQQLRNFLRGSISYTPPYYVTKSDISETRLLIPSTSYPVPNLMDELQSMLEDMLITLLSEPHLVIADKTDVPCRKSRTLNTFVYHKEGLWIGYALAVAVAFGFLLVGGWSIFQNGVASDTQFSRIMVTTRNPTIDRLSVGACLGGDPFPKELTRTKLRFGVLREEEVREGPLGRVEHCCFGTEGETSEIVKYGTYAGLQKWRTRVKAKDEYDEEAEWFEKERLLPLAEEER
ncbi:hypothetical protein K491DRAFT_692772 [Lophiostoma macrostomum CBS 122681]|uniref:Uncharacterized protein n=1 Tax=Lophiostoma macrostomum CBS 122681 TaxID=1314788 RepID=A0A6A6T6B5_9PLEO|nr:hypothetical protein K491DRAFT_692772 [Lophiostoma macrostomum CBS 122681]